MSQHTFSRSRPLPEVLVEHSTYSDLVHLKRRLIRDRLLRDACYECGITDWRSGVW